MKELWRTLHLSPSSVDCASVLLRCSALLFLHRYTL
ncbi:hypothetical protein A2U01_0092639, partial [Trifolium medium]|nr:hypothetical protein [Trifolium medium]